MTYFRRNFFEIIAKLLVHVLLFSLSLLVSSLLYITRRRARTDLSILSLFAPRSLSILDSSLHICSLILGLPLSLS